MFMRKIRFYNQRQHFRERLKKSIKNKPLEFISVLTSIIMSLMSFFVLMQNREIADESKHLSEKISHEQLNQAKVLSDADGILKKRLNEIELKQAEYMKQQAEHILKMTVSMDEYTNFLRNDL